MEWRGRIVISVIQKRQVAVYKKLHNKKRGLQFQKKLTQNPDCFIIGKSYTIPSISISASSLTVNIHKAVSNTEQMAN